jgi:hypothetical protein
VTTIDHIYHQAELALAAYADLAPGLTRDRLAQLRDASSSTAQAEEFARSYPIIVAQYKDTSTSFSATVFAAADGQLHLAIRGTKEPGDFAPMDANIALYGIGFDQVVAMVNWWRRAAACQVTQVAQVRLEAYPQTLGPSTTNAVYIYTDTTSSPVPELKGSASNCS